MAGERRSGPAQGRRKRRAALAILIAGIGLPTISEAAWAHALGIVSLFGFVAFGFPPAPPPNVVPQANDATRH